MSAQTTTETEKYTTYTFPRMFKKDSKLHVYLAKVEPDMIQLSNVEYTLFKVLSALRQVISREKLYDPNNTTVIICSKDLELALGVKFLHVTEIRDVVLQQMETKPELASLTPPLSQPGGQPLQVQAVKFDIDGRYWVKPLFLKVLRMVEACNKTQVVFTYREITSHLSQYIMNNKAKFFDERNIKIAHVENDPLGLAFGVKAFHRTQVQSLLRNQLIPFVNTSKVVKPEMPSIICNRVEIRSPHPQTIVQNRKRASDSKDETLPIRQIRRRTSSSSSLVLNTKKDRDSDEETIYSSQGYNTVTVSDNEKVENSSEDSETEAVTFDVFDIEYEPENDSSDEEQQTKKGRKRKFSNSSGESEIDDVVIGTAIKLLEEIAEYSSDSSDYETSSSSSDENDFTKGDLENGDFWKCLNCKQPNTPYIRYCSACYKERKGWLPDRPKPKKKRFDTKDRKSKAKKTCSAPEKKEEPCSSQDSGFNENQSQVISSDEEQPASSLSQKNNLCTICCAAPKNACLIHGRISHQVCCYSCAKKLFKNHRGCPVCRRKIEKITKNIIA